MKAQLLKLKSYLRKNIWAEMLLIFMVYFVLHFIGDQLGDKNLSLTEQLVKSAFFSLFMVPVFRALRTDDEMNIYDQVDHMRHYQVGQKSELVTYLESKGYQMDYIKKSVAYFESDSDRILSTDKTFIHETDHWIALVAQPEILDGVPKSITSIYPSQQ